MSLFDQSGITPRPSQEWMAENVRLAIEKDEFLLAQAATGVGKTLAYVAPALQSGRRTVVSTPTRQLQMQVFREVERLGGSAVMRVGMANFFSPSRTNRLIAELEARDRPNKAITEQLRIARDWQGLIEEFEAEHGDLLVDRSIVCLRPGCPKGDRTVYELNKTDAADANFIVQTHALTLLELRFRRHTAEVTIFDEAHSLPSIAASAVEARVPLSEIGLEHLSEHLGNKDMVWLDNGLRAEIQAAKSGIEDDDLRAEVSRILQPLNSLKQGCGIVAMPVPSLQRVSVDPARFVGYELAGRPTIFVSATLDPLEQFKKALGITDASVQNITPPKFGSMAITLADRKVQKPFVDRNPNDAVLISAES